MNKKFKRLLALGLSVSMLAMTACSSGSGSDEPTTGTEETDDRGIVSVKRPIEYGDKHDPRTFAGMDAAESDLFVAPIEGLTDDSFRGVDVSSYIVQKDSGVKYYDFAGNELDDAGFFNFLADCGVNWVRIRVWNDPYDKDGMGYGGGNNDVEKAVAMGKLATNAGMKVLIDFHYSDFWADPAKQTVPKAWDHKSIDDKKTLIAEYTTKSLNKIIDAGVDVGMVQVGNETNNGMAGETEEARIFALMKSAAEAIRAIDKEIKIAVHYTNPQNAGFPDYAGKIIDAGVDYDVFCSSYYPFWHGTLEKLSTNLKEIIDKYDKEVMVVETSYIYTDKNGDGHSNSVNPDTEGVVLPYDVSPQGQANSVRDILETVVKLGDKGLGVCYWEPAWIPVNYYAEDDADSATKYEENMKIWEENGSGWAASYAGKYDPEDAGQYYGGSAWDNQAMFDFEGKPLESINVFKYVFSGTTAEKVITGVNPMALESAIGDAVQMPETIGATMIDGSIEQIPVVWNADEVKAAEQTGAGEYVINGKATGNGKEYDVVCNLAIKNLNYVKNEGFEDSGMAEWVIEGAGVSRQEDNNIKSGKACLHFYNEEPVEYKVTQKIENIPAGTYELRANLQGGDAGSNAMFELFILVNGEELKDSMGVSGWQKWEEGVVTGIVIPEGAEVVVGVRAKAIAGAWGAWDDFTLYKVD